MVLQISGDGETGHSDFFCFLLHLLPVMNGFDTGCLATDFAGFFSNKCRDDVGTAAAAKQMPTGQNDRLCCYRLPWQLPFMIALGYWFVLYMGTHECISEACCFLAMHWMRSFKNSLNSSDEKLPLPRTKAVILIFSVLVKCVCTY